MWRAVRCGRLRYHGIPPPRPRLSGTAPLTLRQGLPTEDVPVHATLQQPEPHGSKKLLVQQEYIDGPYALLSKLEALYKYIYFAKYIIRSTRYDSIMCGLVCICKMHFKCINISKIRIPDFCSDVTLNAAHCHLQHAPTHCFTLQQYH